MGLKNNCVILSVYYIRYSTCISWQSSGLDWTTGKLATWLIDWLIDWLIEWLKVSFASSEDFLLYLSLWTCVWRSVCVLAADICVYVCMYECVSIDCAHICVWVCEFRKYCRFVNISLCLCVSFQAAHPHIHQPTANGYTQKDTESLITHHLIGQNFLSTENLACCRIFRPPNI